MVPLGIRRSSFSMEPEKSWILKRNLFQDLHEAVDHGFQQVGRILSVNGSLVWVARYLVQVSNEEKCCNQDSKQSSS